MPRVCLVLFLALALGCASDVAPPPSEPPLTRPDTPLPITVAVRDAGFETADLGLGERFARELRRSGFFRGVAYPLPEGARSRWMLELTSRDVSPPTEPPDGWARFARYFLPAAPFVWTEQTYSLEMEARLTESAEPVGTYTARADIAYRYQVFADVQRALLTAQEVAHTRTIEAVLREIEAARPHIATRTGSR